MVTKPLLLPLLLLTIACGLREANSQAAESSPDSTAAKVDALFAEWAKPDSPGCAVAVVRGGTILYAKGYGMADLEHGIPITPRTVFYIGSVGKQFTAYAVVRLAQQGKLSLDDEIHKYLPELHDFGRPVTIRHLIHHTSGLRDYFELLSLAGTRQEDLVTQKDLLRMIWKQRELNFSPGERHLYSNSNYALLATIVERVTGESFRDWMARNVFAILDMNQTQVVGQHRGLKRIGHNGALAGYRAFLELFPAQDLGVIILSNQASFPPDKVLKLADLFLPEPVEKPKTAKSGSAEAAAADAGKSAHNPRRRPRWPAREEAANPDRGRAARLRGCVLELRAGNDVRDRRRPRQPRRQARAKRGCAIGCSKQGRIHGQRFFSPG